MIQSKLSSIFDMERLKTLKRNCVRLSSFPNLYQDLIEQELISRLQIIKKNFNSIFIYGEFSEDFLSFLTSRSSQTPFVITANIIPQFPKKVMSNDSIVCYEDQLPFPDQTFDLAISCASFHHLNNVPKALQDYKRILKPDGLFLASFAGGDTLKEIREVLLESEIKLTGGASPRIIPMLDLTTAADLIQQINFSLPVVDRDLISLSYSSLSNLFKEIKQLGERNYMRERSLKIPSKNLFKLAENIYKERYLDQHNRFKVTLELIYLLGWKADPSHPQSCARGSGEISLNDVLNR